MTARKTLYLLRHTIVDSGESLLPAASTTASSDSVSLVLLEEAVSSSPSFPGPIYVIESVSRRSIEAGAVQSISYRELVTLIAEHDSTIVL
jgi:hypothetical protein